MKQKKNYFFISLIFFSLIFALFSFKVYINDYFIFLKENILSCAYSNLQMQNDINNLNFNNDLNLNTNLNLLNNQTTKSDISIKLVYNDKFFNLNTNLFETNIQPS